jgi:hypothetical protein
MYLEKNYPSFTGPDKGRAFLKENSEEVLDALKVLIADERFLRSFNANVQLVPRTLLGDIESVMNSLAGNGEKRANVVTAEFLTSHGWASTAEKPPFAWIYQDKEEENSYTLIEASSTINFTLNHFPHQKPDAIIYMVSLTVLYSDGAVSLNDIISNFVWWFGQGSARVFVVFTHIDCFLRDYKPQRRFKIPNITSTSAEGTLGLIEDYFKSFVDASDQVDFLTLNSQDFESTTLAQQFIMSKLKTPAPKGEPQQLETNVFGEGENLVFRRQYL